MPTLYPISEIMLRRRMAVMPDAFNAHPSTQASFEMKITAFHEMMSLGYAPTEELFNSIQTTEQVQALHDIIVPAIREITGANVQYYPMYKGFPQEVMDKSLAELYFNAIVHYWSFGNLYPVSHDVDRLPMLPTDNYKKISCAEEKDAQTLMQSLLSSNIAYSKQDIEDIKTLNAYYPIEQNLPRTLTNKENIATIASLLYQKAPDNQARAHAIHAISPYIKTPNDALRVMNTIYGDGDATLANRLAITRISRPERKEWLSIINKCPQLAEEMKVKLGHWIRVGEILHPGEYSKQFPQAASAFEAIRSKEQVKTVQTFNSKAEAAMQHGGEELQELARTNPGMIARNLDRLLRSHPAQDVYKAWETAAPKVAPNVLWTVYSHFKAYDNPQPARVFITKGKTPQILVENNTREPIHPSIRSSIMGQTLDALKSIYQHKPPMGKVYLDPTINKCKIPNETRTASCGRTLAKGSRIPYDAKKNILRTFIWWTNDKYESRVDVDLSTMMFDDKFKRVDHIWYQHLKDGVGCHSGDITNGQGFNGKGVAEFIDVDLKKAKSVGVRYVISSVSSFTRQPFSQLEHLHAGFMMRDEAERGEIFEPSTVENKVKLSADSTTELVCAFDLETREMVWLDTSAMRAEDIKAIQNVNGTIASTTANLMHAMHLEKPDIDEVVTLNVLARGGEFVNTHEEADVIFALGQSDAYAGKTVITPYDLDIFNSDLVPATSTLAEDFYKPYTQEATIEDPNDLDEI